ncbi:MAG: hypothetical protein K8U57_03865 [Planctomycetes bacterium]|nr:hypothetical protein [Planctomycetota bacterium]
MDDHIRAFIALADLAAISGPDLAARMDRWGGHLARAASDQAPLGATDDQVTNLVNLMHSGREKLLEAARLPDPEGKYPA